MLWFYLLHFVTSSYYLCYNLCCMLTCAEYIPLQVLQKSLGLLDRRRFALQNCAVLSFVIE